MPVVSSQYWNMVYGQTPGQVALDEEGMQTMRTLARNMAWMIKKLDDHPELEQPVWTNFIR
jgi:multimeric flavodoxin WrbA